MAKVTIAGARKTKGMTQRELAEKIGVSCAAVHHWESGKSDMCVSHLKAISQITGFSMDDFILPTEYAEGVHCSEK